jgi:hypothetical protein
VKLKKFLKVILSVKVIFIWLSTSQIQMLATHHVILTVMIAEAGVVEMIGDVAEDQAVEIVLVQIGMIVDRLAGIMPNLKSHVWPALAQKGHLSQELKVRRHRFMQRKNVPLVARKNLVRHVRNVLLAALKVRGNCVWC